MKVFKLTAAALSLLVMIGCQKAANSNSANATNTNVAAANSAATPAPADTTANVSGSPSEVYKAAHVARQKKDIATLKKVFAKDILEFFTEIGKEEKKSIDDMLREMCEKAEPGDAEVRNEKIDGDKATVEYKEKGSWKKMDFVKEDGGWKMTIPKGGPDDKDNK